MLTLVHSPFVGPITWERVAAVLRSAGNDVVVPDLTAPRSVGSIWRSQVEAVVAAGSPSALVAHSGAGPLMPAVVAELGGEEPAVILVDATLPHPGHSRFEEMPGGLERRLAARESHGRLPRWHEWFPAQTLRRLVPDDALRAGLVGSCPEVPAGLLTEPMPQVPGLDPASSAFVRLSAAYDHAVDEADRLGWLTSRLDLHHLAPMTHPAEVAEAVEHAIGALG